MGRHVYDWDIPRCQHHVTAIMKCNFLRFSQQNAKACNHRRFGSWPNLDNPWAFYEYSYLILRAFSSVPLFALYHLFQQQRGMSQSIVYHQPTNQKINTQARMHTYIQHTPHIQHRDTVHRTRENKKWVKLHTRTKHRQWLTLHYTTLYYTTRHYTTLHNTLHTLHHTLHNTLHYTPVPVNSTA